MSSYTIRSGDTLSALAVRYHTSIAALMQANPQIKNANLIYAGAGMNIPGKRDSFQPAPVKTPSSPSSPTSNAFAIARAQLGKNAADLKLENSAVGSAMEDWVPNDVNCASFVAGCLQAAGQIGHGDYSAGSLALQGKLDRNPNFQRVSLANARPGDVVTFDTGNGNHTVMFAGWQNGQPQYIGSNNVNADGSQKITMGGMNYTVLSVQHYRG